METTQKRKRRRRGKESVSGYFRAIFNERPDLLDSKSNKELLDRWLADHPNKKTVPNSVKQNLANVKSLLRKKTRLGVPLEAKLPPPALKAKGGNHAAGTLATLEEQIDDCLTMARMMDREGLQTVIDHLRRARNEVVWKMGQ